MRGCRFIRDKDERDLDFPIVSVLLGLPVFLFGGHRRADRARRVPVAHGDVVVGGSPARLRSRGLQPLKERRPLDFKAGRVNLSFRKARETARWRELPSQSVDCGPQRYAGSRAC